MKLFKHVSLLIASLVALSGCDVRGYTNLPDYQKSGVNIASIEVDTPEGFDGVIEIGKFNSSNINLIINYEDDTNQTVPLLDTYIPSEYRYKLYTPGHHEIELLFRGKKTIFAFEMAYFYDVTFINESTVLYVDHVKAGNSAMYVGNEPTKAKTVQYTYIFTGWDRDLTNVQYSFSTYAQFDAEINSYFVTWKNYDGTILDVESYPYGSIPTYKGDDPTRDSTAQYTYIFNGWSPLVSEVTNDIVYTAQFEAELNNYEITWLNYNGDVLSVDSVPYGTLPVYSGDIPLKEGDAQYSYSFVGWSPTVSPVSSDAAYTALFEQSVNEYSVIWKDYDGSILEIDIVRYGEFPIFNGIEPHREADAQYTYEFTGWSPEIGVVTGPATYTAQYVENINYYEVNWVVNGKSVAVETYEYGSTPVYPYETPIKDGNAQYSYVFTGWLPEIGEVVDHATYVAQFEPVINCFTITWKNYDGTVLEVDEDVPYGSVPTYNGETPTRADDGLYSYSFNGWSPKLDYVYDDATYVATYALESSIFEFELVGSTEYRLSKISGAAAGAIVIPDMVNDLPVTSIKANAALYCINITSVEIPNSITSIGQRAFMYCSSIEHVSILGDLTKISSATFGGCTSLSKINIPESVTTIESNAFGACPSLKEIHFGKNVQTIGITIFSYSVAIDIDSENPYLVFDNNSLFNKDKTILIANYDFQAESLVVDENVLVVGQSAFANHLIKQIYLPNSLVSINDDAFIGCRLLESIILPETVTTIGNNAFASCLALETINIPEKITQIASGTFSYCESLKEIGLHEGLLYINPSAFSNCKSLESLILPSSVIVIGQSAFSGCTGMTYIYIPSSVVTIQSDAFKGCTNLEIYCDFESKPVGWNDNWNPSNCPVFWKIVVYN